MQQRQPRMQKRVLNIDALLKAGLTQLGSQTPLLIIRIMIFAQNCFVM
jgi:hypothetical protein